MDTTIAKIDIDKGMKVIAFKRVVDDKVIYRLTDYTFSDATSNDDFDSELDLVNAFIKRIS